MIKVVCPSCGRLVVLSPKAKTNQCSKCGAQLFSSSNPLQSTQNYKNLTIKELINEGFELSKSGHFKKLGLLAEYLINNHKDIFWGHAFKIISDIEFDILTPGKLIDYKIMPSDIEIDMKARLYFAARKKYQVSGEKIVSQIGYYPDDRVDAKTSKKMNTIFDITKQESIHLLSNVRNVSNNLKKLNALAKRQEEKLFIENYINYVEQITFINNELSRYDKEATDYINNDYNKTPNPGNKTFFLWYSLLGLLSFFSLSLSMVNIGLFIANYGEAMTIFDGVSAIIISFLLLVMSVVTLTRTPLFNVSWHKMITTIVILSIAAIGVAGIVSVFVSIDNGRKGDWFFIIGAFVSLASFVYSIVCGVKYLPKKTNKNHTLIGDYKTLTTNQFSVNFPFKWKNDRKHKLSQIKIKGK